jgi:pyrroloquinoline quinone biosynthesis protein B
MDIIILGSAAGGGFPQWNCACANCRRARAGDPAAEARTQSSLAVSADGRRWVLLNASPDLRQQCFATPRLHPNGAARGSPIAAVVLTNGDVDHVGGLLILRERQPFAVYASPEVRRVLDQNPIFNVLDRTLVSQQSLPLDRSTPIAAADGAALGLSVTPFAVPGKVPLHLEQEGSPLATEDGTTIGLEVSDGSGRFFYIPGCAALNERLARRLEGASLVLFDGTLWRDDEMIANGTGAKTGRRMGHMSMSGQDGSIAAFVPLAVKRKVFIHINNTNPALLADSPERATAEAAGWEIARDGMEIRV